MLVSCIHNEGKCVNVLAYSHEGQEPHTTLHHDFLFILVTNQMIDHFYWIFCGTLLLIKLIKWESTLMQHCGMFFFIYLHIETSSVPQRLVLGPVLFSIFVSDMDSKIEWTFSKFATATTTTELCTVVDVLKGMDVIQSDLDRPVRWACAKPHEFQQSQVQDPAHESR